MKSDVTLPASWPRVLRGAPRSLRWQAWRERRRVQYIAALDKSHRLLHIILCSRHRGGRKCDLSPIPTLDITIKKTTPLLQTAPGLLMSARKISLSRWLGQSIITRKKPGSCVQCHPVPENFHIRSWRMTRRTLKTTKTTKDSKNKMDTKDNNNNKNNNWDTMDNKNNQEQQEQQGHKGQQGWT